jgi:aminomethyltransferase
MAQRTALYDWHLANSGKLVDFSGWDMPVNYGSQIEEHKAVRTDVGMFDVSHMTVVDLAGSDVRAYLQILLANDVAKIDGMVGKALYTGMLNENGGVIDDLIVYNMGDNKGQWYRLVVNCGTRTKDVEWMAAQTKNLDVAINERDDLAMIALQGPNAIAKHAAIEPELADAISKLTVFHGIEVGENLYARTGYTGEDGLEIILPAAEALILWEQLAAAGVNACGLGARDTLRLEAGMNLYGNEMSDEVSPLVANMGWTIAWEPSEREFIGRKAIEDEKQAGVTRKLVGLILRDKGVLRAHQKVIIDGLGEGILEGIVTSGTFSPTLNLSIALARVPVAAKIGTQCQVEIRNKRLTVDIVKPVFVRNGQSLI